MNKTSPRKASVKVTEQCANSEAARQAIRAEWKMTIWKIIFAFVVLIVGVCLIYIGVTTPPDQSLKIQFSAASHIQFTNTPPGVLLIVIDILFLWKVKQDITIK